MRTNRASHLRHKPGRSRLVAFEPLGSRLALAAGGMGTFVLEAIPPRDHEATVEHVRMLNHAGEFATLQQNAWQRGGSSVEGLGKTDGPGWRQQEIFVGANGLDRPAMGGDWGFANHRMVETRVVPTSVQVSGTNLVFPGLLVSRGDALTLVITASPIYGLTSGSQNYSPSGGREPLIGDRNLATKPPVELVMQRPAATGDDGRGEHPSGAVMAGPGPSSGPTLPRGGDAQSFVATTFEPGAAEARIAGGWVADENTASDGDVESAPAQAVPVTGQWAISKTDLDEGLIELESPLAPRRKGRKLPGEPGEDLVEQQDSWAELQAFVKQAWSAWDEAWRELGRDSREPADAIADVASVAQDSAARFDADVIDGLVELAVDGGVPADVMPQHAREQIAGSDAPVRIDAGVAIYQEFEVATATATGADAAPPATARKSDRKAKDDEHAEADKPAEGQPISAAAVGAGMIIGLPFSLRRRHPGEDEQRLPRLRKP